MIPGVKRKIVQFLYYIFLPIFFSINLDTYFKLWRGICTGAKCFVLNRGIEATSCDGMPGLLLPTVLCMVLHIKEMHIAVI